MTTMKELERFYKNSLAKEQGWKFEAFNGCYWLSNHLGRYYFKTKADCYRGIQIINETISISEKENAFNAPGKWFQEANRQGQPQLTLQDYQCEYPKCLNKGTIYAPSNQTDFEDRIEITCEEHEQHLNEWLEDLK